MPVVAKNKLRMILIVKKPRSLTVKRECNYIPEMDSLPSLISNIPDHWKDEQARVVRERPSQSEVQQQVMKLEDRTDSIEEETEGVLPRTFFPLGVDWDSRLEATNYGTDVVLKSSSSSLMLDEPDDRTSPQDFVSVADWFIHTKGTKLAPEATVSMIVNSDETFDDDDKKSKKVMMARGPPRLIFGEHGLGGRDPTILAFQAARKRQRKESRERRSLDKHFKKMNETMMAEGPMDHAGLWTTDEPVAHHIMRRATLTDGYRGRETVHNLIRRSCLKRHTTFTSYLEQLDSLKKELNSIDSVRKVALNNEFLNSFCYMNESNTVDLIIHGKHIFEEAGRRLYDFDLPYIFSFLLERPNIVGLDFCYNHLTCFGVRFLADYLSWDQRILRLNLMNNDIEAMDSYVVDAFGENKTLKTLRLNGNPFGKKGGEYVSFLLMFKDLEFLILGRQTRRSSLLHGYWERWYKLLL
uniref:Leucine-rich repeat-containing protein 34 n=1 Tax=Lygus hesperus TaxID=30085 RepID=A0A0A9XK93_LYGHE